MHLALHIFFESPLLRMCAGLSIGALMLWLVRHSPALRRSERLRWSIRISAGIALAVFCFIAILSLRTFLLDADEADIFAVAAAGLHGQQIYTPVFSTDVSYSMLYGPVMYWIYGHTLAWGHGNIVAIRALIVSVNLLLLAGLYRLGRRFLPPIAAFGLLALSVSLLLRETRAMLGARPEPLALLFLTIAILCASSRIRPVWLRASAVGVFAALAVGTKLTMIPAALFAAWVLCRRTNWRSCLAGVPAAVLTLLLPFFAAGVSAKHYFEWLRFMGKEGLLFPALIFDCLFAVYVLLGPAVLQFSAMRACCNRRCRLRLWLPDALAFLAVLVTAVVSGSKPGAGTWYFLPLLPVTVAYLGLLAERMPPAVTGFFTGDRNTATFTLVVITYAVISVLYAPRAWSNLHPLSSADRQNLRVAQKQVEQVLRSNSGKTVQIGYGSEPSEPAEWLRYLPVLQGQPYTLDASPRLEFLLVPFPPGIAAEMRNCTNKIWLIPTGQEPFASAVFPKSLSADFLAHFSKRSVGPVYDEWTCTGST